MGDRLIPLDSEGFLADLGDWDRGVATQLALLEGLELTDAHWELLNLIRQFYIEYEHAPSMRPWSKYIKLKLGAEKARSIYLLKLFPGSPAMLTSKLAGLPRPDNCL
jgi:tRNA 2-thiouridine synthesizing protein E